MGRYHDMDESPRSEPYGRKPENVSGGPSAGNKILITAPALARLNDAVGVGQD